MYEINTCVTTTRLNDIIKMLKPCTASSSIISPSLLTTLPSNLLTSFLHLSLSCASQFLCKIFKFFLMVYNIASARSQLGMYNVDAQQTMYIDSDVNPTQYTHKYLKLFKKYS